MEEQYISMDDWKPTVKLGSTFRVPSKWRKLQNLKSIEDAPDRDELRKIKSYIRNGVSSPEIIETFNISSMTLKRIKRNKYLIGEPIKHVTPDIIEMFEIQLAIQDGDDEEYVRIDFDISKNVYEAIKSGDFVPTIIKDGDDFITTVNSSYKKLDTNLTTIRLALKRFIRNLSKSSTNSSLTTPSVYEKIYPSIQKETKMSKEKWIGKMHMKKGALHKELGVPIGKKIPEKKLKAAEKKGGLEGKRARLAVTLKSLHKKK